MNNILEYDKACGIDREKDGGRNLGYLTQAGFLEGGLHGCLMCMYACISMQD